MKSKVDKLDVAKLKPARTDLSKLSEIVKREVVKVCGDLVKKIITIDTSQLVKNRL